MGGKTLQKVPNELKKKKWLTENSTFNSHYGLGSLLLVLRNTSKIEKAELKRKDEEWGLSEGSRHLSESSCFSCLGGWVSLQLLLWYHLQAHPQPPESTLEGESTTTPSGVSIRSESGHGDACFKALCLPHKHLVSPLPDLFAVISKHSASKLSSRFGLSLGVAASGLLLFRIITAWQVAAKTYLDSYHRHQPMKQRLPHTF